MVTPADTFILKTTGNAPDGVRHIGVAIFTAHEIGDCRTAHPFGGLEKHIVQGQRRKMLVPFDRMQVTTVPDILGHAPFMPRDTIQHHRGFHILSDRQSAGSANAPAPHPWPNRKPFHQFPGRTAMQMYRRRAFL